MLIEQCMKLPEVVGKLPYVGYRYEVRACNLRQRAIEIQGALDELRADYAYFMKEVHSAWTIKELEEAGL